MHTGLSSFFRLPKNNLNQTFDSDWPLGFCPRTFEWVSKETAFISTVLEIQEKLFNHLLPSDATKKRPTIGIGIY